MRAHSVADFPDALIGENVHITGEDVYIAPGAVIEDGTTITARTIHIGRGTKIERGTRISGLGSHMETLWLGDHVLIGFNNQILAPVFVMGDFSQLHNSGLSSGYSALSIGHNCWIGQNSILNCTAELTIGNAVRIGTQSQLWTHVASGELLEGCILHGEDSLLLEDDVWIVGGAVVSPGLTLSEKSIIMTGSVLTKSTLPRHTYAGVPAKDVTDKLSFWKSMTSTEKGEMVRGFIGDYIAQFPDRADAISYRPGGFSFCSEPPHENLLFVDSVDSWDGSSDFNSTILDLSSKQYNKTGSSEEVHFLKWAVGYRARFVPYDQSYPPHHKLG